VAICKPLVPGSNPGAGTISHIVCPGHIGNGLYRTWLTLSPERVGDGFQATCLVVEEPQVAIHEADHPDRVADPFDAHILTGKYAAEVDLVPVQADAAASDHRDGSVVERVVKFSGLRYTRLGSEFRVSRRERMAEAMRLANVARRSDGAAPYSAMPS